MARAVRVLRWPVALVTVCVALAVFVYFLMPDNVEPEVDVVNATYWETSMADAHSQRSPDRPGHRPPENNADTRTESKSRHSHGTKTSEIDFYEADNDKSDDLTSITDTITEATKRKLPVAPVFPTHITPEVQYGNEKADSEKLRTPKQLEDTNSLPQDSTLKPHITQKPEKPLEVYFKDGDAITTTGTEAITRSETVNDFTKFDEKQTTKKIELTPAKPYYTIYDDKLTTKKVEQLPAKVYFTEYQDKQIPKRLEVPLIKPYLPNYNEKLVTKKVEEPLKSFGPSLYELKESNVKPYELEPEVPPEIQEFYQRRPTNTDVNFTSGHSKFFGISIEDADKIKSTTQSALYNTRVSPTLPTWRDGDDTTTKKYPVNISSDVPQCRSTRLPLCRGVLPYDLAGPAASVRGVDVTSMLPQIEYLAATNCSDRVKHFACALLEPECNPPPYPTKLPCYNLCREIVDSCDGLVPRELSAAFNCNQYTNTNCVGAKSPCYPREMLCGDGSCVPRDWMCDGTQDCPSGEDEASCTVCDRTEYRCPSGGCILKRWLCDGYADCANGEDESEAICEGQESHLRVSDRAEPGEESAGSAPAPAVRRPNRVPTHQRSEGDNDSIKELLITSDSSNALKRNFTRRPLPSRLTPYTRPMLHDPRPADKVNSENKNDVKKPPVMRRFPSAGEVTQRKQKKVEKIQVEKLDSAEDVNIGDLGFFEELEKDNSDKNHGKMNKTSQSQARATSVESTVTQAPTRLNKSINKFERVIDGVAMMKNAEAAPLLDSDSVESNITTIEKNDDFPTNGGSGSISAHASPCPSGELRCVDGRCITLAQLCDGTIDCSDHADEDNCYT